MADRAGQKLTRRTVLSGLLAIPGVAALAEAPLVSERPLARGASPVAARPLVPGSESLVRAANLGGSCTFAVADATTGQVLEARDGGVLMPPASTLKTVTTLYALERLGPDYRFRTEVLASAPLTNGRLDGDLILKGGGDPTLDTDRMGDLAIALREAGLREVTGRFLVWGGALPGGDRIDDEQPEHVSYNPAYGGLNLNFNRVHFQWQRQGDGYDVTMHARATRLSPATNVATMAIVERTAPIFDYHPGLHSDRWSVSQKALGKDGARWLPVRYPAHYAGDVFRTLARSNGIVLRAPEVVDVLPPGVSLAVVESAPLKAVLEDMLAYSTNLTAEVSGLTASLADGRDLPSLAASGARMSAWAMEQYGTFGLRFKDHSGLGYGSAISAGAMVRVLAANPALAPMLKRIDLSLDKKRPNPDGVEVRAKTGTLNFVSALAGYVKTPGGRQLAFSIMTADTERRDAIPPEARERPPGAIGWANRSRQLQKELLRGWAAEFGV